MRTLDPSHPLLRAYPKHGADKLVWVEGDVDASRRRVAIVGSRAADPDAAQLAFDLAEALVRAGVVVVSGGAIGNDRAAHEGALAAGGRTWLISPGGLGLAYPPEHASLYGRIRESGGAVLTPARPGAAIVPGCFHRRNVLLAALVEAVVVVQADKVPSGAHHTAKQAVGAAVPLWVVPVAPWATKGFVGSIDLLATGARPLVGIPQFLRALGLSEEAAQPHAPIPPPDDPLERRVLAALSVTPLHRDGIAERARLSASEVGAALFGLILGGYAVETADGCFRVASARQAAQPTRTA